MVVERNLYPHHLPSGTAVSEALTSVKPKSTPAASPSVPMTSSSLRTRAEDLLSLADVEIGGDRPWDIQVHDERVFQRTFAQGTLGLGGAYMDGWWDCPRLDMFFHRVQEAGLHDAVKENTRMLWASVKAKLLNLQAPRRAREVGEHHYDIDPRLYEAMLDDRMVYSCGYWDRAKTLDQAQEDKLELVCRKLHLSPGMRVLDIGCGWGSLARYAARDYDVEVVGLTVSEEQARIARDRCAGLPVEIRLEDYRELDQAGAFDRVVSVGMFEHVGYKNYRTFMDVTHRVLRDGGLQLLHTIGRNEPGVTTDLWMAKYIFPNSMLPSAGQIGQAADGLFVVEDWHNFGQDYDPTLMAWYENVEEAWPELSGFLDERFHRMWTYYLLSSAGSFRARSLQLWQVVLAKDRGVEGGYQSVRAAG